MSKERRKIVQDHSKTILSIANERMELGSREVLIKRPLNPGFESNDEILQSLLIVNAEDGLACTHVLSIPEWKVVQVRIKTYEKRKGDGSSQDYANLSITWDMCRDFNGSQGMQPVSKEAESLKSNKS